VSRLGVLQRSVGARVGLDVATLLGERAAIAGFSRNGSTSCGGATRLLEAGDGWCACSLARSDDVDAIPAWLGVTPDPADPWPAVGAAIKRRDLSEVCAAARLLSLPVAAVAAPARREPIVWTRLGAAGRQPLAGSVVVDLSSLWAGPLCGHLLQLAGARVIKVESTTRPDGARSGPPAFFDLLHAGQESVALDFRDRAGVAALRALLRTADVVIEGSRPRALEQLGVRIAAVAAAGRLRCWVSITAYGRHAEGRDRVGFGDDVASGAGLVAWDDDGPLFCGDAIADPLCGVTAAGAVMAAFDRGGAWLADVSLYAAASAAAGVFGQAWEHGDERDASPPRHRPISGVARPLGADTDAVLRELTGAAA
jgi:hypothetical protein